MMQLTPKIIARPATPRGLRQLWLRLLGLKTRLGLRVRLGTIRHRWQAELLGSSLGGGYGLRLGSPLKLKFSQRFNLRRFGEIGLKTKYKLRSGLGFYLWLCLGLGVASLSIGCTPLNYYGGAFIPPDELQGIEARVSDKEEILEKLGEPSYKLPFDEDTWYYAYRKSQVVAFYKPELIDYQLFVFEFDEYGILNDLRMIRKQDRIEVAMNQAKTPFRGRELSFLEQLISSYGKGGTGIVPQ